MAIDAPDLNEIRQVCDFAEVRLQQLLDDNEDISAWEENTVHRVRKWTHQIDAMTPRDKVKLAARTLDEVNYGVETIFVISTSHVTEETGKLLDGQANGVNNIDGLVVYPHGEYGWLMWVGSNYPDEITEAPDELDNLLKHCSEIGVGWLLLDRDGPQHPDFSTFDW